MPQGGILPPFLFNVYLDYCLNEIPELKEAVEAEIIVCFADDMIARVKSIQQAEKLIKGLEKLKKFGLDLNKSKSQILGKYLVLREKLKSLEPRSAKKSPTLATLFPAPGHNSTPIQEKE